MAAQNSVTCKRSWCVDAPAKLNLGLKIVGRRPDGYHLLESLFWPISLLDTLAIETADTFSLTTRWHEDAPAAAAPLPRGADNLVEKAHRLVAASPCRIELRKRIPIGSGMGGGSSDAGAYLRHLLATGQIDTAAAEQAAPRLGADVPFFLDPRPTWVSGIGERRRPLNWQPRSRGPGFLIVLLPQGVPTKDVFDGYRAMSTAFSASPRIDLDAPWNEATLQSYLASASNDLQEPAAKAYPLIDRVLDRLKSLGAWHVAMSGSGSTCFAVFPDRRTAENNSQVIDSFLRENNCRSVSAETHWIG